MPEYRVVRDLEEAAALEPSEMYLVRGEDLQQWAQAVLRLPGVAEAEREECIEIAEHYLGQLFHGHGATGDQVVMEIINAIRTRGRPAE